MAELEQSPEKREFIAKSKQFWNPAKTQAWQDMGVDLVIDRREGYFLYDMDGRRLIDLHLNGGTYNIGHRHPELVEVLNRGTTRFDMGNHHFPSQGRTALAEMLARIFYQNQPRVAVLRETGDPQPAGWRAPAPVPEVTVVPAGVPVAA